MRSPYEDFASVASDKDTANTIPYHARENSQPFSYGRIYSKTSTPLRNGKTNGQYRDGVWDEIDSGSGTSTRTFDSKNVSAPNFSNYSTARSQAGSSPGGHESNTTTIKAQPRLTSPLLVRKTLNSRSPTRNSANTIANTYHYSYNSAKSSGDGGDGLNGQDNNKYSTNTNNNNNMNSISTHRKTPTRNDFEELLRERRNKVYNEYKSTATSASAHAPNGQNGQNKYNFDFEFNLNLDEIPAPPRRSGTLDRASLPYRTHDIPTAANALERNYHTISSSITTRDTRDGRELFGRQERPLERARPPLETQHYDRRFKQQESTLYDDRYGNENASGYSSYSYNYSTVRGEPKENMSPIYATSTKQKQQQLQTTSVNHSTTTYDVNRSGREPKSTITDYASSILASPTATLVSRPETPAFPVTPRTPYGANNGYNTSYTQTRSPTPIPCDHPNGQLPEMQCYGTETVYQSNTHSNNYRPRMNSNVSLTKHSGELQVAPQVANVAPHLVKFAKDSSQFWYKPNLTRDEAIALLLHAAPGTFILRDSTTYKNAFGLVLRVAQHQLPPGSSADKPDDPQLVRHFLIEPTTRGVRLKGCANEPVFTSLSALVYEHSINALALPCVLLIPEQEDLLPPLMQHTPAQKQLLTQGAACNVFWLYSCDTESLTGEEAIRKAIRQLYAQKPLPTPTEVHFKVAQQGITLTDNTRKKFFRKHYVAEMISYCAIDPDHRTWTMQSEDGGSVLGALKKTIFAFVARRSPSSKDNQCHVFCDLAINQPASAIVSFANKTLPTEKQKNYVL